MGKIRDLFKKTRYIKGTFNVRLSTIKNRNGKDLTEAKEIKKRQQEQIELYKKGFNDLDNCDDVVTYWSVKSSGPYEALL